MCTYAIKPRNYEVFARTAQKWVFWGSSNHSNSYVHQFLLQKCEKFICKHHDRRLKSYKFLIA